MNIPLSKNGVQHGATGGTEIDFGARWAMPTLLFSRFFKSAIDSGEMAHPSKEEKSIGGRFGS